MAIRTTNADVLEIMDNCTVSTSIIDNMIMAASAIVDSVFANATDVSDTLLASIEQYLTAHMLASTLDRTTDTIKLGDAQVKYTGQWGKKLESTPYGQMVLVMDISGRMAKAGKAGAGIYAVESFDD